MLSTTLFFYIFAPGASTCDISRTDSTHVETPDDFFVSSARLPRWVGVGRKCIEKSILSSRSMYLLPGNPSLNAVEAYRDSNEGRCANRNSAARCSTSTCPQPGPFYLSSHEYTFQKRSTLKYGQRA